MNAAQITGRKILRFGRVTSTNDLAREFADAGEPEGLVITAEEQTGGRGRMGRKWIAPPRTSIQMSLVLRPPLAASELHSITQMAALAVAQTLREIVGAVREPPLHVALKWPNDVLLSGKKCAGILVETSIERDELAYAILGIGLNVNFSMRDIPELAPHATTLADELRHSVDRISLEGALLENLDAYYLRLCAGEGERAEIFQEWRAQLITLGCAVRVAAPDGMYEGVAADVSADGALLLRREGELKKFYAGDVTIVR